LTAAGEGAMVTTNDKNVWERIWAWKDHRKSYAAVFRQQHAAGIRWWQESFDSNRHMTGMQVTTGRIQLGCMPKWQLQRGDNTARILAVGEQFPRQLRATTEGA
jgi:dTDP-4-amino-4,6-dideoxygalactose transaminase